MKSVRLPTRLLGAIAAAAVVQAVGAQTYTLTDLGTLPGRAHSEAFGINSVEQVVGYSTDDLTFGPISAFIWQGGQMTDLGTLGGEEASARSINDGGAAVGDAEIQPGLTPPSHAFLWADGLMEDLGTLGGSTSWAVDVSGSGLVVGGSRLTGDALFHPCLWVDGVPQDLGLLPDHWVGGARGVNASGSIVGYSTSLFSEARAVVWDDGPQDLGTLPGGCCSEAFDINGAGQIAGFSWLDGASHYHAVLWEDDAATDLGTLPGGTNSQAYAINASGQVVGTSWTTSQHPGDPHACLWHADTVLDLNDLHDQPELWLLTEARDINDAGQIVANGVIIDEDHPQFGMTHGVLLTPVGGLPGDFDGDGDVDLDDFAEFVPCMTGPGNGSVAPGCEVFDFEPDDDVDLTDFAGFATIFVG